MLQKSILYKKTEIPFWDDEHISAQMLKAHLNPNFEGASRKLNVIEQSVDWIYRLVPPSEFPTLLDCGCGPGLYAERFAKAGYQVTGIDFSKRSVGYAQNSAKQQGFDISYLYQNYLDMELKQQFDFVTMIYCDYGALSTEDRHSVLKTVSRHLKSGGKFLLDVFSMHEYNRFQERKEREACPQGGFWRKEAYTVLTECSKYTDCVTLEQISVMAGEHEEVYYLWNTYFTGETLIKEAEAAGFQICGVFGDVVGHPYCETSPTIAILLQK